MGANQIYVLFLFYISSINGYDNYQDRPRLQVIDGNLKIVAPNGKHIQFIAHGDSIVSINGINVLQTLRKAYNATKLTDSYQQTLTTYNDRLEALEGRGESIVISNFTGNSTDQLVSKLAFRRLSRSVNLLQRKVNQMILYLIQDDCKSDPCRNGGTCQDMYASYICHCTPGWEGNDCSVDVNECSRIQGTDLGCQNGGICRNTIGSYVCDCINGFVGLHCTRKTTDCLTSGPEVCGHGTCVAQNNEKGYKCLCDQGWTTEPNSQACIKDVDECSLSHPSCAPGVICINAPGSFYCGSCPPGFTGNGYHCTDINECDTYNGGCSMSPLVLCINTQGSRVCGPCPAGYSGNGVICSYQGVCNINNGGCHPLATCQENMGITQCTCPLGYVGNGIGANGCTHSNLPLHPCSPNPCIHGQCSVSYNGSAVCMCSRFYTGVLCDTLSATACSPNPCLNDGECQNVNNRIKCLCKKGFVGTYCSVQLQGCGGYLRGDNGTLKYPNGDFESYNHRSNCAWSILLNSTSKVIKINITKFDIEDSPGCRNDWLEIHDGRNTAAHTVGRFCGNKIPLNGTYTSSQDTLYFWFRSDARVSKGGFELTWSAITPVCNFVLTNTHGAIQSPGSPGNYPLNRECIWRLYASLNKRFMFHFYSLNIGDNVDCNADYIKFYSSVVPEDDSLFTQFCNSSSPAPFYSPGSRVIILFHSDNKDTYPGFQLTYSEVEGIPGCGGSYSAASGIIQSSHPQTGVMTVCEYKITTREDRNIKINFQKFDLDSPGGCSLNYVSIHEGANEAAPSLGRFCGNALPAPIISHGNQLTIISSSTGANSNKGWKLEYRNVCGKTYSNESGIFNSSYNSRDILSEMDCIYKIERPPGNVILLFAKLQNFDFPRLRFGRDIRNGVPGVSCFTNYVEIRDGDHENATLFGRYCGTTNVNITSTHNFLWIRVHHEARYLRTGPVIFEYTSIDVGCGGILRKKMGNIASPAHPDGFYPSNLNCKWAIIAAPDEVIKLTWMMFNIEQSYECTYDNIQVFDNNTNLGTGVLMGKYCGVSLPPTLLSSSNIMTIAFTSDVTVNMDGFLASYVTIKERNVCGGNYFTPSGVIKSPRYPDPYPTNRECIWTINVPPGQQIMLNITDFNIEQYSQCRYDWLEIRNGGTSASPLIGKFCGITIPKQIQSHANKLYIFFKSDLSRSGHGFRLTWSSAATGCGGVLTSPTGSIISPHYPEPYSRNTECLWKIISSAGSRIQAVFSDINLEKHIQCLSDYVQLFDGLTINSVSLGKFCYEAPDPIKSSGNEMLVKFRSDVAFQGRGFQLHYNTVCRNTVKGYRGVIESPNFPNDYPEDQDCLWEIVVSDNNKINITFSHFELERSITFANNSCQFDYVEVSYAEPHDEFNDKREFTKYGKYCGQQNPGHLSLNSDHVQIRFVSDKLLLGSGFRLEWEIFGCGGILKKQTGTISSPNYPNSYPVNSKCEWRIEVDFGKSIQIEFHDIDVEKDTSCDFDSVSVYNGIDDTYNLLAALCRQKKKSVITSTGNFMFIQFKSDYSYHGKGFLANYTTVPSICGGKMTAAEGYIYSSNYPKNYNRNDTCEWFIDVDEGHTIEIVFEDVDLLTSDNCVQNYVKIHDGPSGAFPVLKTVCGADTPNDTIKSSYNEVYVEFKAHSLHTSKGFKLKYHKSCGSKITTGSSGIIEVNHDEFSDAIQTCTWTIISSNPSKHVSLTISRMFGQYYCDESDGPVKIYNGQTSDAPLIGQYCGPKVPPTIVSDGSALSIVINSQFNFFATYSVYDSQCGGTLMSAEGYFATPGYPKTYAAGVQCEWTIDIAPGNHVTLRFIVFDLLKSENCNTDYLEIRSYNASGKLLGIYCGKEAPENITHAGSLWLSYKGSKPDQGDTTVTAKGFYGEYLLNTENEMTGTKGEIWSPLYPFYIMEYKTYTWKITVNSRKKVLLSFVEFYIDGSDSDDFECYFASFEVYDGVDDTASLLGKFCGLKLPDPIRSSSNILFIKVEYNSPRLGTRFKVKWEEVAITPTPPTQLTNSSCGNITDGYININVTHNYTLTSPGYPNGYAPNLKCSWTFTTNPMNHLIIFFTNIDLSVFRNRFLVYRNCDINDNINIYQKYFFDNDWQKIATVCKMTDVQRLIHTTDLLKIEFVTTRYLNGTGFRAKIFEACGGWLRDPTGYIIFNNSTRRGAECQWNITVKSTRTIELTFEELNIEHDSNKGCDNFLMIRNGKFSDSPLLGTGKYCGTTLPDKLLSTGNNLYIKYKGEPIIQGFRLKYQEVSASCGGRYILSPFDKFIEISSPNYPNIPNPHTECLWVVTAPSGEALRIDFEDRFDLTSKTGCPSEYVEVRDGGTEFSTLIGRFCQSAPSSQFSSDNMMFVKFFTDVDDPKNGFKAKISISRCGGTVRGRMGDVSYISSGNKVNCTWHVVGLKDHYLTITFTQLEMTRCDDKNYIKVEDKSNQFVNGTLNKFCAKFIPKPIVTSSNEAIITMATNNVGKFSLTFNSSQTECGGSLEGDAGVIESPGYPGMNHLNRNCKWTIKVPEGRRVQLKILDLDLGTNQLRFERGVAVFDGNNFRVRLALITATVNMSVIESSSNLMIVFFWSSSQSVHRGFQAKYSSNLPTICEGDFSRESGVIQTPSVRNYLYHCDWIHRRTDIEKGKTVAVTVTMNTNSTHSPLASAKGCFYSQLFVEVASDGRELAEICVSTISPIVNRSPFLVTKLKALVARGYTMNFTASYSTYDCGGLLHQQSGTISSPNYPNKPVKPYECAWVLKVDEGQTINVTTVGSNLGDDCEKSFVTIYNGQYPWYPKIGKYCKQSLPPNIISQSNALFIEYKFDLSSTGTGFQFRYEAISSGCGGIFHDKDRKIKTPNYGNGEYPNNAECLWIIESEPGYHIKLNFIDRFHLEQSTNCSSDFVEVWEWANDDWFTLGKKCGRDTPTAFESRGERMKILFRSNDRVTGRGFKAEWQWKCGGRFVADRKPRYIVSPGYPSVYEKNTNCEYVIEAKSRDSEAINIRFLDFVLESGEPECKYDNLTISGRTYPGQYVYSKNTYCGEKLPPNLRMRGTVTINFLTDNWLNRRGFKLEFKDDSCGGDITEPGILEKEGTSENVQGLRFYQPKIRCNWNISAPPNQIVILTITKLEMNLSPSCYGQTLEVYNSFDMSRANRLASLCGSITEAYPIPSETGKMAIKLETMPTFFGGFRAEIDFSHGPNEGCGGFINLTESKEIRSPNLADIDCGWKIIAPRDYQVQLSISKLDIQTSCGNEGSSNSTCSCMFVEVRDGASPLSEKIEMLCKSLNASNLVIRTSTNNGYIRVFIRGQKNNAFSATVTPVKSICGTTILVAAKEKKELKSPNFGEGYPPFIKCSYAISAPSLFDRITIHFAEFNLTNELSNGDEYKCHEDFVQIFEDPNLATLNGLGSELVFVGNVKRTSLLYNEPKGKHIFCGVDNKPFDYFSSGKSITISFVSKGKKPKGAGFKIEYSVAGCNRNYSETNGRINNGNSKTNCVFSVIVPENRTISVYFTSFYGFYSTNCSESALEARDGSATANPIRKVCGYKLPDPIFSTTNKLYFNTFNNRIGGIFMHYDMLYTSSENGPGCGGDIFNNKGKIYSPLYPYPFRNDSVCTWNIRVPSSLHLALKFSIFDIQGKCEQTNIKITTITETESNSVELCSNYVPGVVYRSHSYIKIQYTSSIHNGGTGWVAHFQAVTKEVSDIV